ncbi:CCAAT/enhancer-binding protein delta [Varanus komodoensis]|uniref:CCAAT/enhancer-binding protein delta n=1 Tax=Varanus komodoensis TaxID=61221 RepID=UPI001CF7A988|nr:CCAAT/enhancer-binding protein delta [Varanus komodoensis]KAF7246288.1 CCAAT/enhancer-binding protein delta [Varanus komodoensis]
MSAVTLDSLDSLSCYRSWSLEPTNFYDAKVGEGGGGGLSPSCKPGSMSVAAVEEAGVVASAPSSGSRDLAELSAAAPAMYEDESAIDFSSYIDSMAAVPNLELCNDELFADLFNSNHKGGERGAGGAYGDYLPPPPPQHTSRGSALASLLHASVPPGPLRGAVKQEPEWGDEASGSGSLLPSQIATCAQTVVNLNGQPTPPTSPEPPGSASPSSYSSRSSASSSSGGKERAAKKCVDRFSPEYRQRRERNNIAVRKSRDKAKRRNQEMQQKLVELSSENERLHKKIDQLTRDLNSLRHFFKQLPSATFLQASAATDCR